MDVGYCNSYADAQQADMAAMMVELGKYPEFLSGAPLPAASVLDFSLGVHQLPPLHDTPPATPPTSLISPQPAMSGDSASGVVSPPPVYTDLPAAGLTVPADTYAASGACNLTGQTSMAAVREMMFRIAAMQPIHIDPESVKPPKRRNVRISKDPQSVAARHRRERISEKIRILQRLVPGGTKMDTASMLDEAIHYVKFLKTQVQSLEWAAANRNAAGEDLTPAAVSASSYADVFAGGNYAFIGGDEPPEQLFVGHSWMLS